MKSKAHDGMLTTEELAARWEMNAGTLVNWRNQHKGPKFVKVTRPGKRPAVRYRVIDIEQYERETTKAV